VRRSMTLDRVAAVGDGLDDVGMLRAARIGVAMGNAHPEVSGSHRLGDIVERRGRTWSGNNAPDRLICANHAGPITTCRQHQIDASRPPS
jgi:hypothetical protein